jgi:hypothetical protein
MQAKCGVCGADFPAKRATARFCSARCRKRNARDPKKGATVLSIADLKPGLDLKPQAAETADAAPVGYRRPAMPSAFDATLKQLENAGRLDTALGVAALIAAQRLDDSLHSADTGSGVAALIKAHREALAEATKDAETEQDPLDKIRAAAALKLVAGGQ